MHTQRGVTLIDAIVGIFLMVLIFTGISGVFQLSIEVVSNNKARIGGISLAQERIEFVRSLTYDSVGTINGIPSGVIPQIEQVTLNNTTYTRRTLIRYIDDPADGLDALDENGVTADAKEVKVEVSWDTHGGLRETTLITRVSPPGIEQLVPGGTLSLYVVDATAQPVSDALVSVVNSATSISTQAYSDGTGLVRFIGTPQGAGYEISVTKSGYSSSYTYAASSTNPSPTPGHLTVSNNQTTASTFAIDVLGNYTIRTFEAIQTKTWTDSFSDSSKVSTTASTTISGGAVRLEGDPGSYADEGTVLSVPIAVSYLSAWKEFRFTDSGAVGTEVRYFVYANDTGTLVPDVQLPGNSSGFTVSPIDLSTISTSTYSSIRVGARLTTTNANQTPEIEMWEVDYDQGPIPLPNVPFTLRGEKTIGNNVGQPVYKFDSTYSSGAGAALDILGLEWDVYTTSVDGSSFGYDIAESCEPQPRTLSPGATIETSLYFLPHTTHSLLVDVHSDTSELLNDASVRLYRGGFDETQTTERCGQTFFSGLSSGTLSGGNTYTVSVSRTGYTTQVVSDVEVSGASRVSVVLTP